MTVAPRPDPDQLLERIRRGEERERRAKLKIFFGAAAGVGKTFAMLVEAHELRRTGADVVVGLVETHGRAETLALLDGLEIIPRQRIEYQGAVLQEFDLAAALARKPKLVLLDELAHTNAPGSRHLKRWQDVEDLLSAGIDVSTTLNVQHVDSLNETVERITGVRVRETVPDSVLDRADVIEIVDLPPDDLIQRLHEGKVYMPAQAGLALENFFRKGNLIALRELVLREAAAHVDASMETYRSDHAIRETWPVGGRILVCLGHPDSALRLVRAGRRMATALKASWIVAHVERPGDIRNSGAQHSELIDVMGYAEELGAETAMLSGHRASEELVAFARSRNVSRLIVGKSRQPWWRELLSESIVHALIRHGEEMDVYLMSSRTESDAPPVALAAPSRSPAWREHAEVLGTVTIATGIAALMRPRFELPNIIMVYLLGVVAVAVRSGRGPAMLASVLSVAAFDFFFVPPRYTFAVSDGQYLVTFAVMLFTALVISTLAARMREQTAAARQRERRTHALFRLSRELAGIEDRARLIEAAVRLTGDHFESNVAILLPGAAGRLERRAADEAFFAGDEHERGIAQWAFDHEQPAGLGTNTLPASKAFLLPLRGAKGAVGVLAVRPRDSSGLLRPDQQQLLETFGNQIALALERSSLGEQTERSRVQIETEKMKNALLSSVSHDLRTPLAVISGAAATLLDERHAVPEPTRRELMETVREETQRLNRLVGNLLDMTRLESGAVQVRKQWQSLEEVVGAALHRLGDRLSAHPVTVRLAADLPLVPLDDVLIEQVLFNLVENAAKYSPGGAAIEINAELADGAVRVDVLDRGAGVSEGEEQRVFEKFYRANAPEAAEGLGLGLTIARGIVEAHGGRMAAENRAGGGARFWFSLPLEGEPPRLEVESAADMADESAGPDRRTP
jgi:two-component system, OmpR family, sensor histidine kinase KdpD